MTRFVHNLLFLITSSLCSIQIFAQQNDSTLVRIKTRDMEQFYAHLLEEKNDSLFFSTYVLGEQGMAKDNILSYQLVKYHHLQFGELMLYTLPDDRGNFMSSAIGLKKGHGYFQNTLFFMNQYGIGITDHWSVEAGAVLAVSVPLWLSTKYSFQLNEKTYLSLKMTGGADAQNLSYFFPSVLMTFGRSVSHVTLGYSYGFIGYRFPSANDVGKSNAFLFNFRLPVGRKSIFVSENAYLPELGASWLSAGIRVVWPRMSVNYGLFKLTAPDYNLIPLPVIGVTFFTGKAKGKTVFTQ